MDVVNDWYADAEQLLLRTRAATWWRENLRVSKLVSLGGDPSPEDWREAIRRANRKADDYCDAIEAEITQMESDASALGRRFDNAWIDLFYLGLRNIEIEGLPAGRCALIPLRELVYKVRNWGQELTHANRQSRTLNCAEQSDFIDREGWLFSTVDAIRERLLLERLTIKEKIGPTPLDSTGKGTGQQTATAIDATPEREENRESLEKIEQKTPVLDTESVEWIAARKENEEIFGLSIKTLRDYRGQSHGGRTLTPYFGVDRDGRRWRRCPTKTEKSTVYYFKTNLPKATNKASN